MLSTSSLCPDSVCLHTNVSMSCATHLKVILLNVKHHPQAILTYVHPISLSLVGNLARDMSSHPHTDDVVPPTTEEEAAAAVQREHAASVPSQHPSPAQHTKHKTM